MKNARKFLALFLCLAMVLILAACGEESSSSSSSSGSSETSASESSGESGSSGSSSGDSFHIGYNTWGSGSAVFDIMATIADQAIDAYGCTGSRAIDNNQADTELENIQNFIAADVSGIVMQATATTILPEAAGECEDAGIPFVLSTFTGEEDDRNAIREDNPYYVGSVGADMYAEGYLIGQLAIEDGKTTAVLIGGNVGDEHFEMRIDGFTQSFVTEGGGKILDSARCSSPAEGQEKASALLSAYGKEADMVFVMQGSYVPGMISALKTQSLDLPVYVTNADADCIEYIRSGEIVRATSGNELVGGLAVALLVNYLDGTPILDDEGKAPDLIMTGFIVDQDNVDDFEKIYTDSNGPFTEESLRTLVSRYNSSVDYNTFVDFIENDLTLESLVAAKEG